jgi:hypothetical protein
MKYQTGGAATANWLVLTLLAAGLLSAGVNVYLMRHRTIEIKFPAPPPTIRIRPPVDFQKDTGMVHIFPTDDPEATCTFVNYQCWIRT